MKLSQPQTEETMNTQLNNPNRESNPNRNSLVAGVAIIALGLIALLGQLDQVRRDCSDRSELS